MTHQHERDSGIWAGALSFYWLASLAWIATAAGVSNLVEILGAETQRRIVGAVIFCPPLAAAALLCWTAAFYRIRANRGSAALWWAGFGLIPALWTLQFLGVVA